MRGHRAAISSSILALCLAVATGAFAATPPHLWSQCFGDMAEEYGRSVAVDGSGNVVVTGSFQGTVNLGGGDLTSAGGSDIFIAKYSANGVHLWSRTFGDAATDLGYSVAVDGSGNVVVTGSFRGTVNFGGDDLTSAGIADIFVAKYSADGVHRWSRSFGSADSDLGFVVKVDGSGHVIVIGDFQGTVDFGGGGLVSAGYEDIFVAKYDANGVHQWSRRFGDTQYDYGVAVAVDASENVILTGEFQGTVDFGGGDLVSAGSDDIFLAKYDANGVHQWSQRFGDTHDDGGHSVATDASGNVLVTGEIRGTVDFGGGDLVSAGNHDVFVAKFNANGVHQWSRSFGDTGIDRGHSVAVDRSGNVVVTGVFSGTVNAGGDDLVSAEGSDDIFLAKYDANGSHRWSQRFGGAGSDLGYAVALDGWGNEVVTGFIADTVDFGGGDLVSAGGHDIFVAKFGPGDSTGVGGDTPRYALSIAASPNPFQSTSTIRYTVPSKGRVEVGVYDVRGARVALLVDEEKPAGGYARAWEGRDDAGRAVASGIYFARVSHLQRTRSYKLVLLK